MVPGSPGVSQRFLCCGNGKLELACNQGTVRRNRFTESLTFRLEAHPTVYGWLIGSRVGASSVGLKRAGLADSPKPLSRAFLGLGEPQAPFPCIPRTWGASSPTFPCIPRTWEAPSPFPLHSSDLGSPKPLSRASLGLGEPQAPFPCIPWIWGAPSPFPVHSSDLGSPKPLSRAFLLKREVGRLEREA
eukprot:scaffold3905_cov122-Isochrysis_galbana.AAC.1